VPISWIGRAFAPPTQARTTSKEETVRKADLLVFAAILGLGGLQIFFCVPRREFVGDDVFYGDSGRSLVETGFYGINGWRETNLPPGVSATLGVLGLAVGESHVAFLRAMAVFGVLGFLASYELLRRLVSRGAAAAICLLLLSSPQYFTMVTTSVSSACPYFFAATSALLVARKMEEAQRPGERIAWTAGLSALVIAALAFASAGLALLGAMVATVAAGLLRDRRSGLARLRLYAPVLVLAAAPQALWMTAGRAEASAGIGASEWPVPGFPHSYLAQLAVRSGNHPELGMATARDIPARVLKNADLHADFVGAALLQRPTQFRGHVIMVVGVLFLVTVGWCASLWTTGGGLLEWYFLAYETIYLLWPWDLEARFVIPVAPLAGLYLWRGASALLSIASRPVAVGPSTPPRAWALPLATWIGVAAVAGLVLVGSAEDLEAGRANRDLRSAANAVTPDAEAGAWIASHASPDAVVMARHVPTVSHASNRRVVWFPASSDPHLLMEGMLRNDVDLVIVVRRRDDYYLPSDEDCFAAVNAASPETFLTVHDAGGYSIVQVRRWRLPST